MTRDILFGAGERGVLKGWAALVEVAARGVLVGWSREGEVVKARQKRDLRRVDARWRQREQIIVVVFGRVARECCMSRYF